MAKIVLVKEEDNLEEVLTDLEKEGYKNFSFLHSVEYVSHEESNLPVDHPQRRTKVPKSVLKVVATGKKVAK